MLRTALMTTAVAATARVGDLAQSRMQYHGRDSARTGRDDLRPIRNNNEDRARHCEMREDTIGGANPLDIDAGRNGGIRVRGWDRRRRHRPDAASR